MLEQVRGTGVGAWLAKKWADAVRHLLDANARSKERHRRIYGPYTDEENAQEAARIEAQRQAWKRR